MPYNPGISGGGFRDVSALLFGAPSVSITRSTQQRANNPSIYIQRNRNLSHCFYVLLQPFYLTTGSAGDILKAKGRGIYERPRSDHASLERLETGMGIEPGNMEKNAVSFAGDGSGNNF
jgi:hypothetical protein